MMNEYSTFNDVENVEIRAWNRCAIAFNIVADEGVETMRKYLAQFSDKDRKEISNMYSRIKNDGYDKVRRVVSNNLNNQPRDTFAA